MLFHLVASVTIAADVTVLEGAIVEPTKATISFESPDGRTRKIGLVRATERTTTGTVTVVEKFYDEVCSTPCTLEMPVGWHEFHFEVDEFEWVKKLEIQPGTHTIELKRWPKVGLWILGVSLTAMGLTAPIGIPIWIQSMPAYKRVD